WHASISKPAKRSKYLIRTSAHAGTPCWPSLPPIAAISPAGSITNTSKSSASSRAGTRCRSSRRRMSWPGCGRAIALRQGKRERARRVRTGAAQKNWKLLRGRRLKHITTLLKDRCPRGLPDDDAGRGYLFELLLVIPTVSHGDIKMPYTIRAWAP